MSQEYLTDGSGSGLWRSRTCSHVSAGGALLFVQDVEVDLETGFSPGDPKATLEFSNDRGVTWRSCGVRSIGAAGETAKRLLWRSVGYGRHLTFRVTVSDPARVYVTDARMRVRKGTK